MFSNKRSMKRSQCRIPLLLAWNHPDNFHEAVASNISRNGMCLKSCQSLSHDTTLYIKKSISCAGERYNPTGEAFVARVRWLKKKRRSYGFDVGIEHLTHCYIMDQIKDDCDHHLCDMCGNTIETALHQTEEHIYLCTDCFWNIGSLGKSIIQSSVTRFLSGNVF